VAILSFGAHLSECLKAADLLGREGDLVTVADARFAKPLDTDLIDQLARHHEALITVEQGARAAFGAHGAAPSGNSGGLDRGRGAHDDAAGPLHRPGQPRRDVCRCRAVTTNDRNHADRRARLMGPNVPTFYRTPCIWCAAGRLAVGCRGASKYLDCYNNVPHVGHCHPRVVQAICAQAGDAEHPHALSARSGAGLYRT
jgi:hypothetical protein